MMVALLWLTMSAPFVYAGQQLQAKYDKMASTQNSSHTNDEESCNPFSNTTEEKAPSSSFSEEYLHDHHTTDFFVSASMQFHKCEDAGTYNAFHGELLVPPPNQA